MSEVLFEHFFFLGEKRSVSLLTDNVEELRKNYLKSLVIESLFKPR